MDAMMESAHVKHGSPSPPAASFSSVRHRMSSSSASSAPSGSAVIGPPMGNGAPQPQPHQHQHAPTNVMPPHHHSHHMIGGHHHHHHHQVVSMPPTRPPRSAAAYAPAPHAHHPHHPHAHHYRRHPHSHASISAAHHHPHHPRAHPHVYAAAAHHNPHHPHHHIAHAHAAAAAHHAAYHAPQQHSGAKASSSSSRTHNNNNNKSVGSVDISMQQPTPSHRHASPPEQQQAHHNHRHASHHPSYSDYPRHVTTTSNNHAAPTPGYHRPMPLQPVANNVVQQKHAQNKQMQQQQQQPKKVVQSSRASPTTHNQQQQLAPTAVVVTTAKPLPPKPCIPASTLSAPIPAVSGAVQEPIQCDPPAPPPKPAAAAVETFAAVVLASAPPPSLSSESPVGEISDNHSVLPQALPSSEQASMMDKTEKSTTLFSVAKAQRAQQGAAAAASWIMKSPVTQCFERMLGAAEFLSQYPTPEIFKRQEQQEEELSKKRKADMLLKVKSEDCEDGDTVTGAAKRTKAASKKSFTKEDAAKLDPSNPFLEILHDEELHQKVVLQMALINDGKEVSKKQETAEPVSNVIGEGFYWRDYPVLEEILYDNMANYYSMSAQNRQSRHQQEFNNALVDSVRHSAVGNGLAFDPTFTDKRLRDRIRCFYKTHLQNAKKRLATLQKHPNSAIHQYNLRIYIRCVKENISVEDSQKLESSSAARDYGHNNVNGGGGGPSMVQPMLFLTGPPAVVLRSKPPKDEEEQHQQQQEILPVEPENW